MTSGIAVCCMICLIAFVVISLVFAIIVMQRLNSIEDNTQKTAILLTVIANKQGATQEDILNACSSENQAQAGAAQPPQNKASKKK
ncbi:hypothetical protein IJT93_05655 [bacterium]|nr:hypothetical protein [bacterium]